MTRRDAAVAPADRAAPALRLLSLDAVPPRPWRNGGGATRELLRWPPGAVGDDDFRWRLSVARIAADGRFSAFAGVQRWFAVLDGGGVRLRWPDGRSSRLAAGDAAVAFDGGDAPDCTLDAGATDDLNLMRRTAAGAGGAAAASGAASSAPGLRSGALVRLDDGAPWRAWARWQGVYLHTAAWIAVDGAPARRLPARTLAWLDRGPCGDDGEIGEGAGAEGAGRRGGETVPGQRGPASPTAGPGVVVDEAIDGPAWALRGDSGTDSGTDADHAVHAGTDPRADAAPRAAARRPAVRPPVVWRVAADEPWGALVAYGWRIGARVVGAGTPPGAGPGPLDGADRDTAPADARR